MMHGKSKLSGCAAQLLLMGASVALSGMLLSILLTLVKYPSYHKACLDREIMGSGLSKGAGVTAARSNAIPLCASAYRVFPASIASVSEGPGGGGSLEGRVLLVSVVVGALLITASWHPYTLSNVCSVHDAVLGLVSSATLRSFVPALGFLMILLPSPDREHLMYAPPRTRQFESFLTWCLHVVGMLGCFFAYGLAEIWASNVLPTEYDSIDAEIQEIEDIVFLKQLYHTRQRWIRLGAAVVTIIGCTGGLIGSSLLAVLDPRQNPASMSYELEAGVRVFTYLSEAIVILGHCLNLLIIWFYSPERRLPLFIERDLRVLERLAHDCPASIDQPLSQVLSLPDGPLKVKVDHLEADTYLELEANRQMRRREALKPRGHPVAPASPYVKHSEALLGKHSATPSFQNTMSVTRPPENTPLLEDQRRLGGRGDSLRAPRDPLMDRLFKDAVLGGSCQLKTMPAGSLIG